MFRQNRVVSTTSLERGPFDPMQADSPATLVVAVHMPKTNDNGANERDLSDVGTSA
jgi:hypothetical protein